MLLMIVILLGTVFSEEVDEERSKRNFKYIEIA